MACTTTGSTLRRRRVISEIIPAPLVPIAVGAPIETVLFDADGVIQRAPGDIHTRLTAALGGAPVDVSRCMTEIFAAEAPALVGGCDFADELASVLARWNSANDLTTFLASWLAIDVDRSVLALVGELRRAGVHCALASNQEARRARHMSEALGYREAFDAEFYSCALGCRKPSAAFFAEIQRLGGFDPARTLFIDDRADNVTAAEAAGLRSAHFVLGEIGSGAAALRPVLAGFGLVA
jgi:putative hydrolase of the HAD superfamily